MKKILIVASLILPLAACTQTEKGAAIGATGGAIIGGAATNNVRGAAVGAAIGGVAGALIGNANEPGRCIYRDRYGRRYEAAC
ncbi:glycine zipper domain-containing protein [Ensifer adhaerens]|uniref:glycine zipper domain-containing protein n=1 Tax=Ensifer adhaerens TaxID=106592 RepID=UPI0023A9F149|nr:glycine zipper domain-containing protein [Ensifer adhaerens]WDZ77292.1 glycine zipper domain-containing protein [Ensifer adhaerens]